MPGLAGLETVMSNHGAKNIGDPQSTFGVTEGNPIWEEMRDIALRVGPSFLLNVTLNEQRQITGRVRGRFAGGAPGRVLNLCGARRCRRVKAPFEIVVTTNSGYPLDQNLYQGVKGMSAGARIIQEGGDADPRVRMPRRRAARKVRWTNCCAAPAVPEEILALLATPGFVRPEQWQAQIQALIQRKAKVLIYSSLPDEIVRAAHLTPCHDIGAAVQ